MAKGKFIKMSDGIELFANTQDNGHDIWLIHTHGIGEHLGRHQYLSDLFETNFNLFFYDLRGHGRSLGGPATIDDFWRFMQDLDDIIHYLRKECELKRYILFGHSMGGMIVCGYLQRLIKNEPYPERIFITAPPVGIPGVLGKIIQHSNVSFLQKLCDISPNIRIGGLVSLGWLSHNPKIREEYLRDGLCQTKLSLKLLLELVKTSKEIFSSPINANCPAFVSYGTEDKIIDVYQLQDYFQHIDCSFKIQAIPGAFHEPHFEIQEYKEPYIQILKDSLVKKA